MSRTRTTLLLTSALLALPALASAQGRGNGGVPPGHLPPAGECRVWYDGRPPGHQPPPTDCATARREAARTGGRVVYGGDRHRDDRRGGDWRYDDRDDDRWDDRDRRDDRDDDRWDDRDRRDDRWGRDRDASRTRPGYRNDRGYGDPYGYDYNCDDRDWRSGRCAADWEYRCLDRNRDGWCDATSRDRLGRLPEMAWALEFARGRVNHGLRLWLPSPFLEVRLRQHDRHRLPEEAVWVDRAGRPVQSWIDHDRDGRADRIVLFRDGRPWRTIH